MKKKVLVVEQDEDILHIISLILTEEGFQPILSKTEEGVFDIIRINQPDIIILDVVRPTHQGTELCRAIKAAETTRHIPVIVLSTHSKIHEVKKICADEVINKPFDITILVDVVKEQLAA